MDLKNIFDKFHQQHRHSMGLKTISYFYSATVFNVVKHVSMSMLNQHYSQSVWPQTGRAHKDKGFSHSGNAAVSLCLSQMGNLFGWPPWTISSLYTQSRSHPLMTQSETYSTYVWPLCYFFVLFFLHEGQNLCRKTTIIELAEKNPTAN